MSDDQQQSVLPAIAFFQSPAAIRLVASILSGLLGFITAALHWTGVLPTNDQIANGVTSVFALVSLWFTYAALRKRSDSAIQPLTLTTAQADARNASNPPVLEVNPAAPTQGTKP